MDFATTIFLSSVESLFSILIQMLPLETYLGELCHNLDYFLTGDDRKDVATWMAPANQNIFLQAKVLRDAENYSSHICI